MLEAVFLAVWPVIVFLSWWPTVLPTPWYIVFLVVTSLVYLRLLLTFSARWMLQTRSQSREKLQDEVNYEDLARLQAACSDDSGFVATPTQIQYFALSVLSPQAIRRRVTDRYEAMGRNIVKTVTIEYDLSSLSADGVLDPPQDIDTSSSGVMSSDKKGVEAPLKPTQADPYLLAYTLPPKGELYDNLQLTLGDNSALPSLSQQQSRLLVARTFQALLRAAVSNGKTDEEVQSVEAAALAEIIRFRTYRTANESLDSYRARLKERSNRQAVVRSKLLQVNGDSKYLALAAQFFDKFVDNFALVCVLPPGCADQFIVSYQRTLVPSVEIGRYFSASRIKERIRFFLGARPVVLSGLTARNAVTAQSYHLVVLGPPDTYVAGFKAKPISSSMDAAGGMTSSPESYWRIRGRYGQNYFHLYMRGARAKDSSRLTVDVDFFEVPPGSMGRSGIAAIAAAFAIICVGAAVSILGANVKNIDTDIAAFVLAIPGLAAAWLGLDSRQGQLLEGTLASRISLIVSFGLSVMASALLFLNKSQVVAPKRVHVFVNLDVDKFWLGLSCIAVVNALMICYVWWARSEYYSRLATKPVSDSAVTQSS